MQHLTAQIVVPVHRLDRPIRRAVESVLANERAGCIIVAHGLVAHELDLPQEDRIEVIELREGLGFPGIAFNAGIRAATAPLVGVMGSDDWFDEQALDTMALRAEEHQADGVIAPLRHAASSANAILPVTWRRTRLRAARDRLFFRTAPLGLFRRSLFHDPKYLFEEDVVAGVDQRNGALLFESGLNIVCFPADPAYVVGDDAKTRVTTTVRPLSEHAEAWVRLWDEPSILSMHPAARTALAEKFLQVHVLGLIASRPRPEDWIEGDGQWLAALTEAVLSFEPHSDRSLVRARGRVLRAIKMNDLNGALAAQSGASYLDWRLPAHPSGLFRRNFWLRVRIDTALSRLRNTRDSRRQTL